MGLGDNSRGKQAEARRVRRRARWDEWLEKVVRPALYVRTAVRHAHDDPFAAAFRAHFDTSTRASECVLGIDQQVQDGLLQLSPIAIYQTCRTIGGKLNGEPCPRGGKPPQVDRNPSELGDIDVDAVSDWCLRKRCNLRDCRRHSVALRTKALQRSARGAGKIRPRFEQFDGTADDEQRIVDFVHDSRQ